MPQYKSTETKLIHSTPDRFYDFFRNHSTKLHDICPEIVRGVQVIDASVGRKEIKYTLNGRENRVVDEVASISDNSKTIIFKVLEGDFLISYDIIEVHFVVTGSSTAKWTIFYDYKGNNHQDPDDYLSLLESVNKAVDRYFARN